MELTSSDIARITGGTLTGPPDIPISELATDSRQISLTENVAFIAIKGKNHDGHTFIDSLFQKGVRVFLVGAMPERSDQYTNAAFILTHDPVEALQLLAAYKRTHFNIPIIAVTGSAGKTIVKEWLADIIGRKIAVVRSPKSYNSQIGVPLSVWKLDSRFGIGIFEAGISYPGEMEKLRRVIEPDIGIITNIGDAHGKNFPDNNTKASEKLKLFTGCSLIIYCKDHEIIHRLIRGDKKLSGKILIDWSLNDANSRIYVIKKDIGSGRTLLVIKYNGVVNYFEIPFTDRASVENAITVASACLALGIEPDIIKRGLSELVPVAMRMEIKKGINNCTLIEDYYNSDPGSFGIALEYLTSQSNRKQILILSDFVQSSRIDEELYGEIADLLKKTGLNSFIGIGPSLSRCNHMFDTDSLFYSSTDDFIKHFNSNDFRDSVILIKGARAFELEKIAQLLESQTHNTVLEINLDAISHNLNEIRRLLNKSTRIMAMVKAFAYGAGPSEIAGLLEYHRISYLAVAYTDEGIVLRDAGVTLPVMVMNPDPSTYEIMIRYNLEPELYSFSSLEKFKETASRHGLYQYPVHIKLDTGMHRLGFLPSEIESLSAKLKVAEYLKVVSVFSHLAGSENPALDNFTHKQAAVFIEAADKIKSALGYSFLRHLLNTSGVCRFPQYQFDMVRPGIGIYGAEKYEGIDLRPVGRFKTKVSQVKSIEAGDPVGYGCNDIAAHERTIAVLPVGYADGLNRKLGNRRGSVFIKGKRYPIAGNICMDMCMVDISGSNVREGDEAEIFGENISVGEIAGLCETIPYEILTSIPGRVKRVFYRE